MNSWKRIDRGNLPLIGQIVLLMDVTDTLAGRPLLSIAVRKREGEPPETYWDCPDQQYAIFEKWTHWIAVPLPTDRILKLLADEVRKERTNE